MMGVGFATLILGLCAVAPASPFAGFSRLGASAHDQQRLQSPTLTPSRNYSVGFSLASSYGAAAVIIDDAYDEQKTLTWVIYGDSEYQDVMARLSLDSSRHLAPPYDDMQQYFDDVPRVLGRRLKKKVGLPASTDVGVLATVIKKLRSQIESDLEITVSDATLATTHLEALYEDDVADICEYERFKFIIPKGLFKPAIVWETPSAYAGHGFGLCEHWQNDTQCRTENNKLPDTTVLAVHYSRTALTSTLAEIQGAISSWEEYGRRVENFTLGSEARNWYVNEEDYWRDVKDALVKRVLETPGTIPKKIMLTGDMVHGEFIQVLEQAMMDLLGHVPPIFSDDAMVVAARALQSLGGVVHSFMGQDRTVAILLIPILRYEGSRSVLCVLFP